MDTTIFKFKFGYNTNITCINVLAILAVMICSYALDYSESRDVCFT